MSERGGPEPTQPARCQVCGRPLPAGDLLFCDAPDGLCRAAWEETHRVRVPSPDATLSQRAAREATMPDAVSHEPDPYWTDDGELTTVRLGRAHHRVHIRSHQERERYGGVGSETVFALSAPGERTYLQSRLYFHAPPESTREQRLADGQAWYYPAEAAIVLWELVPASPWWQPDEDPREDFLLRTLWLAYERFLTARFPQAARLLTTWEDQFSRTDWQGFLTTLGYQQTAPAGFTKAIARV